MVKAQDQLVIILCKLERIFPPAFFDIRIHLVLHLLEEAILGGPVYMRWMYPFERYLKRLKDYVRNAAKPEGSISEGYVVDEALTFCSRYFDDIETRFNRPNRNDDGIHRTRRLFVFESQCKPMGKQSQVYVEKNVQDRAEFYILNNSPEIETFLNQHKQELQLRACLNPNEAHRNEFADWFFEKIYAMNRVHAPEVTHELLSLSSKSNIVVSSYPACIVNGVRFVTHARDVRLKTQNSGVSVPGTENEIFYGQLQEILEFSYLNDFSVVLFKSTTCRRYKGNGARGSGTNSDDKYRRYRRNPETQEWPGLVPLWKTFHTNKKGEWVNEAAAQDYELQSQTQEAASLGAEVDEHAVTRKVLGERRSHEKGVGRKLKGFSGSTSSTAGSRASCAPGSSSSGPTYEEFAAMQAQFATVQAES
ncbi:hypothetical protein UlMin_030410 [Ulmus minor]